jgi:HKD family nuclease
MKLLRTTAQINRPLIRLISECTSCQIAVAWASVGFPAFDSLLKNCHKIEKMVVGTHFYQTHPNFIEAFKGHSAVKFLLNPAGIFHPKIYFFEKADGGWECIIGSPNFTKSGLGANDEIALLITNLDEGSNKVYADIKSVIESYWRNASTLSEYEREAYKKEWRRKRPILKNLKGKFGNPEAEDDDDHGIIPFKVELLNMSWSEFYKKVSTEKNHPPNDQSFDGRLRVIRSIKQLFDKYPHFKDVDLMGRKKIAGIIRDPEVNYFWFGSTRAAGLFKQAIAKNDENVSLALDAIPSLGEVTRHDYIEFVKQYKMAFPQGGSRAPTYTRLLAMKRPDIFLCLNRRNNEKLCKAFEISRTVGYEKYWDSIIERVKDLQWWYALPPSNNLEREVWDARCAFLDSLSYDGRDMPAFEH